MILIGLKASKSNDSYIIYSEMENFHYNCV